MHKSRTNGIFFNDNTMYMNSDYALYCFQKVTY